ncbi:phage gp45-like [Bradyrhizobium sp. USDA 4350]
MLYEHEDGIRSTTRRSRVVKVDDSRSQQRIDLKGLKNEKPKKIWRAQDFGFTSNPPVDTDGVMIQMGSRSDRTVYLDGGHEKYRPKNTPEGCVALFNQYGDIVRVFKDNADFVHQKKVNIRIGHGYAAGQSGDSGNASTAIDDQSSQDTTNISIVLNAGDSLTVTYDNASAKFQSGKITLTAPKTVIVSNEVHLGGEGGTLVGLCGGGCATKVYAL